MSIQVEVLLGIVVLAKDNFEGYEGFQALWSGCKLITLVRCDKMHFCSTNLHTTG
jgi:hypothetical protein